MWRRIGWSRAVGWMAVVPATVWALFRIAGWDTWYPMTQLMSFTPYVALLSLIPLATTVLLRRWDAAVVAGIATIALAVCVLPRWVSDSDASAGAKGAELRVLTANVLAGAADPAALVRLVTDQRVDVLLVQELTEEFVTAVDAAGMAQALPHRVLYPRPGTEGSGIYARQPLHDEGVRVNPGGFRQAKASVNNIQIESVHPMAPWGRQVMDQWRRSLAGQPRATVDGPLRIIGGDFNATLDHSLLRDLISSGYRDAADVVGKGFTGTWGPYDGDPIPPVTVDRVLADRRIGVVEVQVFGLPGSDHRNLLAVLRLP